MKKVIEVFENANKRFLYEEKKLILSGVSERALCGSFMLFLDKEIKESIYNCYCVDVEYNRNKGKIKTIINSKEEIIAINCDIIVHSRGEIIGQDNLIAIEMKKSTAIENAKIKDKERLIALTKDSFDDVWSYDGKSLPEHVCRYKLGIYYEINIQEKLIIIEYYKQGKIYHKYTDTF